MKLVIIGNGPAAVYALQAIDAYKSRCAKRQLQIKIVSAESTHAYAPMFLVNYLTGEFTEEHLFIGTKDCNCETFLGKEVIEVLDQENKVVLKSGRELSYDKLLIATGASPIKPNIKGLKKKGIHFFNRLSDVKKLSYELSKAQRAVVVGAGAIGIEVAIALNKMGKKVTVVELLDEILPQLLDKDLASIVRQKLNALGINFILGQAVTEMIGKSQVRAVLVGNREIETDLVVVATGVKPNIDFLKSSTVKRKTGIIVNKKMQTNVANIFAAGDVVESIDPYGDYEVVFNWYNAVEQGWIAGANIIGAQKNYSYSPPLTVLKGMAPPVISIGQRYGSAKYDILSYNDKTKGFFAKLFVTNGYLDCFQAIGMADVAGLMYNCIKGRKDLTKLKDVVFGKGIRALLG